MLGWFSDSSPPSSVVHLIHYLALLTEHTQNIFNCSGSEPVVGWFATRLFGCRAKQHYTVVYSGTFRNLFMGKLYCFVKLGKGCQSSMGGPEVSRRTRWLGELCSPLGMLMLNQKGNRVSLVPLCLQNLVLKCLSLNVN